MSKTAVILVNLGTPTEPTPSGIGRFLKKFLSDPRVVEVPRFIWWFILRLLVIPLRAKRVAAAYRSIWMEDGSPLRVVSEQQCVALNQVFQQRDINTKAFTVETYGEESLADKVNGLRCEGFNRFVVIPLYPQYSCSTTAPVYDQLADIYRQSRDIPDIRVVKEFHDHPLYIDALAQSIESHWQANGKNDLLMMSFHGVPKAYIEKGDPYYGQCKKTAELLAERLSLSEKEWCFTFQSRFGRLEWVKPYTDETLIKLGEEGRSVDIVSPAFVADCLETLEELKIENRHLFLESGGKGYAYIPCVNDSDTFIDCLATLVEREI